MQEGFMAGNAEVKREKGCELIELARKAFGTLNSAEETLLQKVAAGEVADFTTGDPNVDDPAKADGWGEERTLRAELIVWLCTNAAAAKHVTHRGIWTKGARIAGELDLSFTELHFPIIFERCVFENTISLIYAAAKTVAFFETRTKAFIADGISVRGDLRFEKGTKVDGMITLIGGSVAGDFSCSNASLVNPTDNALKADRIQVRGSVFLRDEFRAEGRVSLINATIGGNFDCTGAKFVSPNAWAIVADGLKVQGTVFFSNGFQAKGEVRLLGANIEGNLECKRGQFINPNGAALSLDRIRVGGDVILREGFEAVGEVRLLGAFVGNNLDCEGGSFQNPDGRAISADWLIIQGEAILRWGFKASGAVSLRRAVAKGSLDCEQGLFSNPGKEALSCDGGKFGSVFLRHGFEARGEVRLLGARIENDLDCEGGKFHNPQGWALSLDGVKLGGNAFLRKGFEPVGRVSFVEATIERHFSWREITLSDMVTLDMRNARVKTLDDEKRSWPPEGQLFLDGLVYEHLSADAPKGAKTRLEWLRRQPQDSFRPQPYEHLASVLRRSGHEDAAKKILYEKAKETARQLPQWRRWGQKLFFGAVGYGYHPFWALGWAALIIFIGAILYWFGFQHGAIEPLGIAQHTYWGGNEPVFQPLAYSLDTFLPLVDLHQTKYWLPSGAPGNTFACALWGWLWFQVIMGWILTTLFVAALAGLVRR